MVCAADALHTMLKAVERHLLEMHRQSMPSKGGAGIALPGRVDPYESVCHGQRWDGAPDDLPLFQGPRKTGAHGAQAGNDHGSTADAMNALWAWRSRLSRTCTSSALWLRATTASTSSWARVS